MGDLAGSVGPEEVGLVERAVGPDVGQVVGTVGTVGTVGEGARAELPELTERAVPMGTDVVEHRERAELAVPVAVRAVQTPAGRYRQAAVQTAARRVEREADGAAVGRGWPHLQPEHPLVLLAVAWKVVERVDQPAAGQLG